MSVSFQLYQRNLCFLCQIAAPHQAIKFSFDEKVHLDWQKWTGSSMTMSFHDKPSQSDFLQPFLEAWNQYRNQIVPIPGISNRIGIDSLRFIVLFGWHISSKGHWLLESAWFQVVYFKTDGSWQYQSFRFWDDWSSKNWNIEMGKVRFMTLSGELY